MPSSSFTLRERELIRREFCRHFGQDPSLADGILLRTWHSGPHRGEPMHLLVDSTGLKLCGAGEWLIERHGTRGECV